MIRKIADLIVSEISGLNFVDRITGVVKELEINKTGEVKRVPNALNTTTKKHELYLPETDYKSVIFFEDNGVTSNGNDNRYNNYTANLRLVAWYNLPKINEAYTDGALLTQTLIYTIPDTLANSDYLVKICVDVVGEVAKSKAIFSRYDFKEDQWQYLNYPFDYAAIDLQVKFSVPRNSTCFDTVVIDAESCKTYSTDCNE